MKKTWKQWIAIACAFTMIAGILPAAVLADEEAATPTNLAAASEEIQEEPGAEMPGEEPAEEGQEEAPGDEPGEEPAEVGQTEEPVGDDEGEEPAGDEQGEEQTEDEQGEEPAEEENEPQNDLPRLSFGKPGYNGTLKAGEEFRIVFVSDLSRNFLVTLTLLPGADQIPDTAGIRMTYDGISQELARIENEDPESSEIRLQFGAYAAQDVEYVITVTAPFDTDFILTADSKPAEPTTQEDEINPVEGGKENGNPADNGEDPEEPADGDKDEETEEPGPEIIRLWITADGAIEIGEPVKLIANADPELTGVPTWYVRNAQVEDNAWQKIGYGEYLTVETAEGNEYRFVMPDGTESEVLKLGRSEEPAEEEPTEEEPTDETTGEEEAGETPVEEEPVEEEPTEEEPKEEPAEEATGEEEAGETEDGDTAAGDDETGDTEEEVTENTDEEKTEETGEQVNEETEKPENPEDGEEPEEPEKEPEVTEDTEETEKPEDGEEAEDTEKTEEETENTEETEEEANGEETDEEEKEDEDGEEEEPEEEPEETEEPETQTDSEELLALGYFKAWIVMSEGADIFESMEEDAEPVDHLEAGTELWISSTENEEWAEIYSADEEAPARYIRLEDVDVNPETEAEEEELLPDPEELLALGYYGTQIVMSEGADIFESMEEDAEPVDHLEAGTELWIRPTEDEAWAEIYRADEETPARYIRWDDVIINQKPETDEEEELPARSIVISSTISTMEYIPLGAEITMTAELINFREDDECVYQWQYQPKGSDTFIDIEDANDLTYVYFINEENFYYTWRLTVLVTKSE